MEKLLSISRGPGGRGTQLDYQNVVAASIIQTPGQGLVRSWMSSLLSGYEQPWTMPILRRSEATIPGPTIGCPASSISIWKREGR
jgi:hypothetical protein